MVGVLWQYGAKLVPIVTVSPPGATSKHQLGTLIPKPIGSYWNCMIQSLLRHGVLISLKWLNMTQKYT